MRRLILLSAATTATLTAAALFLGNASAQAPPRGGNAGPGNVALVDVQYIFKNHHRFKQQMEEMRKDVEAAEAQVKQKTDRIRQMAQQLDKMTKGTLEYKRLEQQITEEQTGLAIQVRKQKREFLEREAKVYHNAYKEVWQEVDYVCKSQGISLVLRFNGDPADGDNPEEVLRDINKPVVWYRQGLDITPIVLQGINRDSRGGSGPANHNARGNSPFSR